MSWLDRWFVFPDTNTTALTTTTGEIGHPNPPEGNGWVWFHHGSSDTGQAIAPDPDNIPLNGSLATLQGKFRAYIHAVNFGLGVAGLTCLQNQHDMSRAQGGTGYAAVFLNDSGGHYLALIKLNDGIGDYTELARTVANDVWDLSTTYVLEVEFDASSGTVTQLGGPILTVRFGTDPNALADVEELTLFVDVTSPYTSSVNVGLAVYRAPATTTFNVYMDVAELKGP